MPNFKTEEFMPKITLLEEKPEKGNEAWANKFFHMVPNIACITLFTKMANRLSQHSIKYS